MRILVSLLCLSPAGQRQAAANAKRAFVNAKRALKAMVDLCDVKAGKCDPGSRSADSESIALLESAERQFIEKCLECSTAEKCDAERDRMRAGNRSPGAAPCD